MNSKIHSFNSLVHLLTSVRDFLPIPAKGRYPSHILPIPRATQKLARGIDGATILPAQPRKGLPCVKSSCLSAVVFNSVDSTIDVHESDNAEPMGDKKVERQVTSSDLSVSIPMHITEAPLCKTLCGVCFLSAFLERSGSHGRTSLRQHT